jgi:L-ascorbate metabolism protein UlaG (beta-lactamase superfamily)
MSGNPAHFGGMKILATILLGGWLGGGAVSGAAADSIPLSGDHFPAQHGDVVVHPIHHATLALGWNGHVIYVDPVGGARAFAGLPAPTLVLITHEHFDHFNVETLLAVVPRGIPVVAPPSVARQLPRRLRSQTRMLANGQKAKVDGIPVEAVPAHNTTPERLIYHPSGRDNGYVLTLGGKRIYLSGDTEDIPEMRALKHIDIAFVCMNLPYTMTVEQAAAAVRAFRPKVVYPYHYQGQPPTDLQRFKKLLAAESGIEVRLRDWYPGSSVSQ